MPYDLPLVPSVAFYDFDTTLSGTTYSFRLAWNAFDSAWYMDLLTEAGVVIVNAIKLTLGSVIGPRYIDRVDGWPPGFFYVIDTSGLGIEPGYDDLGTRIVVRFYHEQELGLVLKMDIPFP